MSKLQEIRKKLRLSMDGLNSTSMRERGIQYKLNFGVPLMTLRKLAITYYPDANLADELWKEDTRELKILATLIQPADSFEQADSWVQDINNLELAEQTCMNLFSKMPEASSFAVRWIQSEELYIKISGFLLYSRLFMQNVALAEDKETYFYAVFNALNEESLLLRNAALNSLKRLGRQSVLVANDILARYDATISLPEKEKQIVYEDLKFEFDYYS